MLKLRLRAGHPQMDGHASLVGVDDIELQLGQDLLQGFQIQARPSDVRYLFILLLQCQKTARLSNGIGDALLLVGLRLAQPRARLTPCLGNEVARVGAGLVDHLLAVGHGIRHVLESLHNRSIESDRHNARRYDTNAAVPAVKELLSLGLDPFLYATRPLVSTSSMGMPTTVSVSTPSAMASMKASGSSIRTINAAGSRITYCRTRAALKILVSPVSSSMPDGAADSPVGSENPTPTFITLVVLMISRRSTGLGRR